VPNEPAGKLNIMKQYLVNYKCFRSLDEASVTTDQLDENNIEYKIVEVKPKVDITFTGNLKIEYWLQVNQNDIERIETITETSAKKNLDEVNSESYLNEFSNDELLDIINKYDEWSKNDYLYSLKLLAQRGIQLSEEEILQAKNRRLEILSRPEKAHPGWIIFSYISSFLGGFLGIVLGWLFYSSKKTLPTGKKVPAYDSKTQLNGRIIFILGIVSLIIWAGVYLLHKSNN
jgi:hypothetical protein